jgi:hypothetical protein
MRKYFPLSLILVITTSVSAQNSFKRNDIYGEMFGNGIGIVSLNYERQLKDKPGFGFRLGLGYFSDYKFPLSVPVGINYLINLRHYKSLIDVGAGVTWSNAAGLKTFKQEALTGRGYDEYIVSFIPSIGYRQHIINDKFMWRFSLSSIMNKYRVFPYLGLSAGMRF